MGTNALPWSTSVIRIFPSTACFSVSWQCLIWRKISKFQWIAIVLAIIGVGHEIFRLGSIAWETALVAIGYSAYFLLRKKIKTDNLGAFGGTF